MARGAVEASSEQISLELTVDQQQLEQQLNEIFGGTGAGRPAGGMAQVQPTSGESGGKGIPVQPGAGFTRAFKPLLGLFGIGLGITALVKSSKLMAATSGMISSVLGAMMDTVLAPFIPLISEKIAWLAENGIPALQRAMETVAAFFGLGGTAEERRELRRKFGQRVLDPVAAEAERRGEPPPSFLERQMGSMKRLRGGNITSGLGGIPLLGPLISQIFGLGKRPQTGSGYFDPLEGPGSFQPQSRLRRGAGITVSPSVSVNVEAGNMRELVDKVVAQVSGTVREQVTAALRDTWSQQGI